MMRCGHMKRRIKDAASINLAVLKIAFEIPGEPEKSSNFQNFIASRVSHGFESFKS